MSIDAQGNIHDRGGRFAEKQNSSPSEGLDAGTSADPHLLNEAALWSKETEPHDAHLSGRIQRARDEALCACSHKGVSHGYGDAPSSGAWADGSKIGTGPCGIDGCLCPGFNGADVRAPQRQKSLMMASEVKAGDTIVFEMFDEGAWVDRDAEIVEVQHGVDANYRRVAMVTFLDEGRPQTLRYSASAPLSILQREPAAGVG